VPLVIGILTSALTKNLVMLKQVLLLLGIKHRISHHTVGSLKWEQMTLFWAEEGIDQYFGPKLSPINRAGSTYR